MNFEILNALLINLRNYANLLSNLALSSASMPFSRSPGWTVSNAYFLELTRDSSQALDNDLEIACIKATLASSN